jgi:hypothetical protein
MNDINRKLYDALVDMVAQFQDNEQYCEYDAEIIANARLAIEYAEKGEI